MKSVLSNVASSKLITAITPLSESISLSGGTGLKFPTLTGGDTFNVVIEDALVNIEICKVIARDGDILTVLRGQEGTVARTFNIGDRVAVRLTAGAFATKEDKSLKDLTDGYVGLTGFKHNFRNVLGTFVSFFTNNNTASRTYTFQDRNGTILDNTDLASISAAIATKANKGINSDIISLNAPALGEATATTQPVTDNSTKVATTAHVKESVDSAITSGAVPAGLIIDFAGNVAPLGYLALPLVPTVASRVTYARLYAAIGNTWGAGNGTTTFNLPYCPANYAGVQSNGNVGTQTVGEVINHAHPYSSRISNIEAAAPDPGAFNQPPGPKVTVTSTVLSGLGTGGAGGAANLAAGVRFLKCVKL